MRFSIALVLAIAHFFALPAWAAICYNVDGARRGGPNGGSQICSFNGIEGHCCGTEDICLQNGLCKTPDKPANYWRDGCSSQDWNSVPCLSECTGGNGNSQMTPCDTDNPAFSETWCCGGSNACCGGSNAITLKRNIYTTATTSASTGTSITEAATTTTGTDTTTTSSSSETSTSSSASTSTSTSSTTTGSSLQTVSPDTTQSTESSSLSTGGKVGLGVGVGVGALTIISFLVWFLMRRRRQRNSAQPGTYLQMGPTSQRELNAINQGKPRELDAAVVYEKSLSERESDPMHEREDVHELEGAYGDTAK